MAEPAEVVRIVIKTEMDAASQRQTEAQFDQSMNKMTASAGKAEAVVTATAGQMSGSLKSIDPAARQAGSGVQQMAAMLTAGKAPLASMTEQAVNMAGALAGGGAGGGGGGVRGPGGGGILGAATRVSSFFGGPWGIGLAAAGFALTALLNSQKEEVTTLDEVYDKLVKSKAQTALNEEADRRWASTIDGLTAAIARQNAEMKKRLQTEQDVEQAAIAAAEREVSRARNGIELGRQRLRAAQLELAEASKAERQARGSMGAGPGGNMAAVLEAQQRVRIAQAKVEQEQNNITRSGLAALRAEETLRGNQIAEDSRKVKAAMDPVVAATEALAAAEKRLNDQRLAGNITREKYRSDLERERQKLEDVKAAQAKTRGGGGSGLYGNQVDQGDAEAIARRAGFQVNSSERTTARQRELYNAWVAQGKPADRPVAKPGTSAHEAGGSKWALDIQLTKGVTPESIRKAFAEEGVRLTKVILEHAGRVLHVEGARPGATVAGERTAERDAAKAALEAARAAEEKKQQEARFDSEMRQLEGKLVEASAQRVTTMEAQLEADQKAVDAATQMQNAEYEAAAAAGRITEAQAKLLIAKNNQVGAAEKMALLASDLERQAEVERQLAAERMEGQIADAQYEVDIAKTAKDRLAASLRLLDLQQERERIELQAIIDTTRDGDAQHEIAEERLRQLDRLRARGEASARADPANKSPIEQYQEDLDKTAGQIDEDLERITVDGLEAFNDGLVDAIMGAKSLGEVFDDVANQIIAALIRIAIQQLIIKPLADILGGGMSGGGGGSPYLGVAGTILGSFLPGRAGGGPVKAGGAYWVGENGPEPFFPSQNGQIIPNNEAAKLLGQGGGNNAPSVSLVVNAPGATAETVSMIRRELAAAAPMIVSAAQRSTISQLTRPRT